MEFRLPRRSSPTVALGEPLDEPRAGVVSRCRVFAPRITEPDDQAQWIRHGCDCVRLQQKRPAGRHRRAGLCRRHAGRLTSCRPSCPTTFRHPCPPCPHPCLAPLSPPFSAALSPALASSPAAAASVAAASVVAATSSTSATTRGMIAVATAGSVLPRVTAATPVRQLEIGHVDRLADGERRQVDFDERRQVLRQARHVEFGQHVADDCVGGLVRRRILGVREVQRHLDVDLALFVDTLEIDVQHFVAKRMHLHVAQQYALRVAVEFHGQDRRMKRFLAAARGSAHCGRARSAAAWRRRRRRCPGARPLRRSRRLAPRPSVARGKAVNSCCCMVRLLVSAAFRVRRFRPSVVRGGDTRLRPSCCGARRESLEL